MSDLRAQKTFSGQGYSAYFFPKVLNLLNEKVLLKKVWQLKGSFLSAKD
jgi:hypothetical protein